MSEGTKLGETVESFQENVNEENETLKATKIGEISDFEKELFKDSEQKKAKEGAKEEVKEEKKAEDDAGRSELERFLDEESSEIFEYEENDVIKGTVRSVEKGGVLVDFKFKSDGFVYNSELGIDDENRTEKLEPGQVVDFLIEKLETKEGYALLSRKKAQIEETWDTLIETSKDRGTVLVSVNSKVQGGLVASYKSIKGFIPASQVLKEKDDELDSFINQAIEVAVLQVDRRRKKVIFSHKASQQSSRQDTRKILSELEVGQTRSGKVTSVKDFGAFVDLGGIEGLVHISELSWARVNHPSEFVEVGQDVNVFILGVDKENRKISLGMKQLQPDPWVEISSKYEVGTVVEGKVTRVTAFGAFIRFEGSLEGLIHISELSHEHIEKVEDVVKVGQEVKAKIIKLISEEQKIGLTLKNVESETESKENAETKAAVEEEKIEETEEAVSEDVAKDVAEDVAEESNKTEDIKEEESIKSTENEVEA
ncbi:30S ribosomal protein S1 [Candidatus Marinamargulisbacteria bacterium SCGC AG-343-D04]|nr:30S ribosomal protein S1 [Candidatus Marinamargulisbacteria bacterium SCGC AG-343-D04]RAP28707.1 30S ribosomal protein S1 [Candidatus Marinamargulisbacteria bacterium SCGC AG-343-D04]